MRFYLYRYRRQFFWSLPVIVLMIWGGLSLRNRSLETLAHAKTYLLEWKLREARELFRPLVSYVWIRDEAELGLKLTQVLLGEGLLNWEGPVPKVFEEYPLRAIALEGLTKERYEPTLRLSRFLSEQTGESIWPVVGKASEIEMGTLKKTDSENASLPADHLAAWLQKRMGEVEAILETNPGCVVFDRKGHTLGQFDQLGRFQAAEDLSRGILPLDALSKLYFEREDSALRLSIDLELSKLAAAALKGYRGSIAILNPKTREVLAAVSDPRTYRREGAASLSQLREPASISKLITTSAALRAGIDPDEEISHMTCRGAERFSGHYLYCAYQAGPLKGLDRAMAVSCNVAFASLGVHMGREAVVSELRRFWFDRPSPPGIEFGKIIESSGDDRQLADLSIGLEATAITPIHAALMASVFANQGTISKPRFFAAKEGLLGISPNPEAPEEETRILDPEAIAVLRESMMAVTEFGTGHGIAPEEFPVAMKTGTAQEYGSGYHTNYIGYGPVNDPVVAFCVRVTHQRTSSRVRNASVHVTRRLLRALAKYYHQDLETILDQSIQVAG